MSEPLTARVANATPKTKGALTEYVVLQRRELGTPTTAGNSTVGGIVWAQVKNVQARSANEAIKLAAGESAGTYIAVPARSWKPVTVKVEQTTRITLT